MPVLSLATAAGVSRGSCTSGSSPPAASEHPGQQVVPYLLVPEGHHDIAGRSPTRRAGKRTCRASRRRPSARPRRRARSAGPGGQLGQHRGHRLAVRRRRARRRARRRRGRPSRNGPRVRGVNRSSQAPASIRPSAGSLLRRDSTRLDFPIPASPWTRTTQPRPAAASRAARASSASWSPRSRTARSTSGSSHAGVGAGCRRTVRHAHPSGADLQHPRHRCAGEGGGALGVRAKTSVRRTSRNASASVREPKSRSTTTNRGSSTGRLTRSASTPPALRRGAKRAERGRPTWRSR